MVVGLALENPSWIIAASSASLSGSGNASVLGEPIRHHRVQGSVINKYRRVACSVTKPQFIQRIASFVQPRVIYGSTGFATVSWPGRL